MTLLVLGLAVFLGIHLVPTLPALRAKLIGRLGEGGYKLVFAAASAVGLGLVVWGFGQRDFVPLWTPPEWTRHVTFLLMLPVFVLLAAAYIPSRIRTAVRHPMLAAIKLWAFAHLLSNGDLAGVLLFGSFLAYAVYDRISVKRRGASGPLGDARGGLFGDLAALAIGLAVYGFMLLWGHEHLIGLPLIGAVAIPS